MKFSRKFILIVLLMVALFFGGAILGSQVPSTLVYTIITAVSISITLIGIWFYNGHKKDADDE